MRARPAQLRRNLCRPRHLERPLWQLQPALQRGRSLHGGALRRVPCRSTGVRRRMHRSDGRRLELRGLRQPLQERYALRARPMRVPGRVAVLRRQLRRSEQRQRKLRQLRQHLWRGRALPRRSLPVPRRQQRLRRGVLDAAHIRALWQLRYELQRQPGVRVRAMHRRHSWLPDRHHPLRRRLRGHGHGTRQLRRMRKALRRWRNLPGRRVRLPDRPNPMRLRLRGHEFERTALRRLRPFVYRRTVLRRR